MYDLLKEYQPVSNTFISLYNNGKKPSTVHATHTTLFRFFSRYLFQKAISFHGWTLPENWPLNYFLYTLYAIGYISIADIPGFSVIPQYCTLAGYNVFKQPKTAVISNPAFEGIKTYRLEIDKNCVLLQLTPDYIGILDLVGHYADLMALTCESLGVNLVNSQLAYVFACQDKTSAESFKKMFDQLHSGNPAAFVDKKLFNDDGSPAWLKFDNDVGQSFIAPELLTALHEIENDFNKKVGIPVANTEKKERLITGEVYANRIETTSLVYLWYESIKRGIEKARDMFPFLTEENFACDFKENTPGEILGEEDIRNVSIY